MDCFVITCEHGGNRIPAPYRSLFGSHQGLLDSHRGYDPGALLMAKELAKVFSATLVSSTISRLLVDLNRSIGHRNLFSLITQKLSISVQEQILQKFYQPYRAQVEQVVQQAVRRKERVVHISSHSFTPVLDGTVRTADVGLLYDPARKPESQLCARWKASLQASAPHWRIRRNYPYLGKGDGLTSHLRSCFGPRTYVGVELEFNHQILDDTLRWKEFRANLIDSLKMATGYSTH